jgi:lactaldehyde dehydrogenase / glycolaldehyde dehydrogenase
MRTYRNFIDGHFSESNTDSVIEVDNPATSRVIARVSAASRDDALRAVEAASRAQKAWKRLSSIERGEHLRRFADAITARASEIGAALALESGKSADDARNEALYAADITRYHAEWARRIEGEVIPSDTPNENLVLHREPIGVVACLIPFNYPVYTLLRKIAPALITGNTVVVRPSNNTPASAFEIAEAAKQAGLPDGVFNVLAMDHTTAGVVCTHRAVGMITLTGSVGAGRIVLDYCKENIAKPSLELGGKTPAIIEPDADLEAAASAIVASKTTHPSRMGPLISRAAQLAVHAMVDRAVSEGATIATGGTLPDADGYFYPPTLLVNCRHDMEIVREEIFGPVLPVIPYETLDHALAMANDHQYGLSSVLYTENYRTAMRVANEIEAGELYINRTPADPYQGFHAGWKRSGLGGDDGKHGMLEFTQTRLVVMKY